MSQGDHPAWIVFRTKAAKLNTEYLDFIRGLPCVICGASSADPHHANLRDGTSGMGTKSPDYYALPFCRKHHNLFNAVGWGPKRVVEEFNLDLKLLIIRHLSMFIIQAGNKEEDNGIFF